MLNIADIQSKLAGHPSNSPINLPMQDVTELVSLALLAQTATGKATETEAALKGAWLAGAEKDTEIKYLQGIVNAQNAEIAALKAPAPGKK